MKRAVTAATADVSLINVRAIYVNITFIKKITSYFRKIMLKLS
jgi:hypothetical protein